MVNYSKHKLSNDKTYSFDIVEGMCHKTFNKTVKNINQMLSDGHPITLIIPESILDSDQQEDYRKFFCKEAKEQKENFIYFTGPISFRESDPFEGTMFDF